MNKNILIIHYNTPYLTECLVRSINLFVKDAVIYIFDNSDKNPFIAHFDNVTVFDNTNGEIIDFDELLERFPERKKTNAFKNNYASAKHCLSVQKCMELINDNFVLLDSDVLLRRSIDDFFDDKYIFIGSTELWKTKDSNVRAKTRAIPYICYINVDLCKKYNISYFDEKHIFGLSSQGDSYDTGTFFFEQIYNKKIDWKKVAITNYIVHYKAASWVDEAKKFNGYKQISVDKWINLNKKYWYRKMENTNNKRVIYTCITGDYDFLREPTYISDGFDYVCFTDNTNFKSNVWIIKPLPKEVEGLSQIKKQRYVKINPHKVLSEYDLSIWVDGCVSIKGDLNKFIDQNIKSDCSIYVPKHPSRDCIYNEATVVIRMKKDNAENVNPQIEKYKNEGFPKKYGLLQSNILLRKHNEADCIKLMEDWFEELKNGSHRDQLSFNYASWKNKDIKVVYMDKFIYKSEFFLWNSAHSKKPTPSRTSFLSRKLLQKENPTPNSVRKRLKEKYLIRTL